MKKNKGEKVLFKSLIMSFLFLFSSNLNAVINDILILVGNDFLRISEVAENLKKSDMQEDWVTEKFKNKEHLSWLNLKLLENLSDKIKIVFLCSIKDVPFLDNWLKEVSKDLQYIRESVSWIFFSGNSKLENFYFRGSQIALSQNIREFDMVFGTELSTNQCANEIKGTLDFWRSSRNLY